MSTHLMTPKVKKMKKQATYWKKIFRKHLSDKGLVSRIYKNSYNSVIRQPN